MKDIDFDTDFVLPATEEDVVAFEKQFGVELPAVYRQFLISPGGGCPELDWVPLPFVNDGDYISFFFSINAEPDEETLADAQEKYRNEKTKDDYLVIATSPTDNLFLLKVRGEETGAIYFQEEDVRFEKICDDFPKLIDRLEEDLFD
ncbi:MAG: SMI1/KNR4 family protein [Verrucomicrobiota bacterium]